MNIPQITRRNALAALGMAWFTGCSRPAPPSNGIVIYLDAAQQLLIDGSPVAPERWEEVIRQKLDNPADTTRSRRCVLLMQEQVPCGFLCIVLRKVLSCGVEPSVEFQIQNAQKQITARTVHDFNQIGGPDEALVSLDAAGRIQIPEQGSTLTIDEWIHQHAPKPPDPIVRKIIQPSSATPALALVVLMEKMTAHRMQASLISPQDQ